MKFNMKAMRIWIYIWLTCTCLSLVYTNDICSDTITARWRVLSGSVEGNTMPTEDMISPRQRFAQVQLSFSFLVHGGNGMYDDTQTGLLADLWRFNILQRSWERIFYRPPNAIGLYGFSKAPGAREDHSMVIGADEKLYMFGGHGYADNALAPGYLNDLWSFDFDALLWDFLSGSQFNNDNGSLVPLLPGARSGFGFVKLDSGNLVLTNGEGYSYDGLLYDAWVFDVSAGTWSNPLPLQVNRTLDPGQLYVSSTTKAVYCLVDSASSSLPGTVASVHGLGLESNVTAGLLYQTTYLSTTQNTYYYSLGSNVVNVQVSTGVSGGRQGHRASCKLTTRNSQSDTNIYIHGGYAIDASGNFGLMSDVWAHVPRNNILPFPTSNNYHISGDSTANRASVYTGFIDTTSHPGGRADHLFMIMNELNQIVFGGYGIDTNGELGLLNDVWMRTECACQNGYCQNCAACECFDGYWGDTCQHLCTCINGDCDQGASGTGYCANCTTGYYGLNCADECQCVRGTCNEGPNGDGSCNCERGYSGNICDAPERCFGGECGFNCVYRNGISRCESFVAYDFQNIDIVAATGQDAIVQYPYGVLFNSSFISIQDTDLQVNAYITELDLINTRIQTPNATIASSTITLKANSKWVIEGDLIIGQSSLVIDISDYNTTEVISVFSFQELQGGFDSITLVGSVDSCYSPSYTVGVRGIYLIFIDECVELVDLDTPLIVFFVIAGILFVLCLIASCVLCFLIARLGAEKEDDTEHAIHRAYGEY